MIKWIREILVDVGREKVADLDRGSLLNEHFEWPVVERIYENHRSISVNPTTSNTVTS